MKNLLKLLPSKNDFRGDLLFRILLIYLVFSQVYYSYRYFLSYGSSRTSPTALDTPLEFQIPRYAATLGFYLVILLVFYRKRVELGKIWHENWSRHRGITLLLLGSLIYLTVGLLKFDFDLLNFSYKELIKTIFFAPIALLPFLIRFKDSYLPTLLKFVNLALIFQIVGFVIVYLGFVIFGRAPAQAYPESMTRFGGLWDDPNALALFLLIPLFTYLSLPIEIQNKYAKLIYLSVFVMAIMIFMALSLTSWIIMVGGLTLLLFVRRNIFLLKNIAIVAVTFLVLAFVSPYSKNFLEFKAASLAARVYQTLGLSVPSGPGGVRAGQPKGFGEGYLSDEELIATLTKEFTSVLTSFNKEQLGEKLALVAFGKKGQPIFSENFYIMLIFNYGLVGIGLFVFLLAIAIKRSIKKIKTTLGKMSLALLSATGVGLISLPYLAIFPVSVYLWLIVVLLFRSEEGAV